MKTTKYLVKTYLSDGIVSSEVEVSRTKFQQALNKSIQQYNEQEKDSEFYVDMDEITYEYPSYTAQVKEFTFGICYIDYCILKCKDGYRFTR